MLSQAFCAGALDKAVKLQGLQSWVNAQAALKKAGVSTTLPLSLLTQ